MSRKSRRHVADPVRRPQVVVCRGGDCGSKRKHPGFDHFEQLRSIQALAPTADVIPSACLDACTHSNVIVVLPSEAGRVAGAGPVWIGGALSDDITDDISAWVRDGGPGVADAPALVHLHQFRPTRTHRQQLDEVLREAARRSG